MGLFPDYAEFDGRPTGYGGDDYHKDFRFDAWRNGMNIAVDYVWFGEDKWAVFRFTGQTSFLEPRSLAPERR